MNININKSNRFDAIVIGAGMSGGWAAKEFTEKGLNTLVLERGRNVEHVEDYPTAHSEPWDDPHRFMLSSDLIEQNPIVSKCYAFTAPQKDFFVKDHEHPYVQIKPFDWIRGYQVGGKSLLWARQVQRWSNIDFTANAKDDVGVDWPIRYEDLAPWYSHVEKYIGVSGNKDGLSQLPDGEFLPAFEMNCVEEYMKERIEALYPERHFISGRTANITQRHNDRGPCILRDRCGRGCPYGGYYSANSSTIPAAKKTGYMTLRPHSVVHSIIYDADKQKATGVRVIDANTKESIEFYSDVIFLNAGTINTIAILLNSKSERFSEGLGNENDVLGRYIMDHDYRGYVTGIHHGFRDKYYSGHRPTGCYVPRFRNIGKDKPREFLRGYAFATGASRGKKTDKEIEASYGIDFKRELFEFGSWTSRFTYMGEQLPYYDNRISLSEDMVDEWGIPLVEMDCEFKENENQLLKDAMVTGSEMLEAAGFKEIKQKTRNNWNFGLSIHEMGGARMGKNPKDSILNRYNQIHSVKNVFVSDGACMTSSACQNPSITYMALTARAVNFAVDELKKGNL